MSHDEMVYTFFHEDGPIRLIETELCNEYMRLLAAVEEAQEALREVRRQRLDYSRPALARLEAADDDFRAALGSQETP